MLPPPRRHTLAAMSVPVEKERTRNWEECKPQSNWAQGRPTHGSETSPNRTHNNTQGNHEVRALQQPPNAAHAERAISKHSPPSLDKVPRAPGGARHGGGNRAVTSQPRTGQSTSYGDVKLSYGGAGGWDRRGPGAPTDRGRSDTDTQNAGATPGGTRASTANKEEGQESGEATRTVGTGSQNGADGRARAWEAATIKGMAWPASPVATGCQGNPCSTGIRWGVSPAAQMGCLRNRSGRSGADLP